MVNQVEYKVVCYHTSGGGQIYQIPILFFPGLLGQVYLVFTEDYRVLIDTGSGYGESNKHLIEGLNQISQMRGEAITLSSLTHILVTHGHIDHFGGLNFVLQQSKAKLGIHELDRRIITNHEERLSIVSRRLEDFLIEAGVSAEEGLRLLDMYRLTKNIFRSVQVDFTYEAIGMCMGPFEILHVPGHCAGHVLIRVHDVIFSGDHILMHTSPHLAPEQITLTTGLDHYLKSLVLMRTWVSEGQLILAGHEEPIINFGGRIDEIRAHHYVRLQKILDLLVEPHTVLEVSKALFGQVTGYDVLLAIEETGAHIEYLYQRGLLGINNLTEWEKNPGSVPISYQCIECKLMNQA
jgi:glyoxylase-like metal-dependent hydrolase (beta-lactamase superfamily II)